MMTSGVLVSVDVADVGVVTGKVAWFGGRVYMKDDGVTLWTGLNTYVAVSVDCNVMGWRLTSVMVKAGTGIVVVTT